MRQLNDSISSGMRAEDIKTVFIFKLQRMFKQKLQNDTKYFSNESILKLFYCQKIKNTRVK